MPPIPQTPLPRKGDIVQSRHYNGDSGSFCLVGVFERFEGTGDRTYGVWSDRDGTQPLFGGYLVFSKLVRFDGHGIGKYRFDRFPWRDYGVTLTPSTCAPALRSYFGYYSKMTSFERVLADPLPDTPTLESITILKDAPEPEFFKYGAPWCCMCQKPVGRHWVGHDKNDKFIIQVDCHGYTGTLRVPADKIRQMTSKSKLEFTQSNILVIRTNSWGLVDEGFLE